MTWTMEEAREDLAKEAFGYEITMVCTACSAHQSVLHDDRTEAPWSESELTCEECGQHGMVEL